MSIYGALQEAMEVFLYYVYKDELDSRLDAELAAVVLHIAQYYGAPRLAGLCERLLAREIKIGDPEDEGVPSPGLLRVSCVSQDESPDHASHSCSDILLIGLSGMSASQLH